MLPYCTFQSVKYRDLMQIMGRDVKASLESADKVICKTEQRLKKAGLTRSYYMKKLKDLCEAQKAISCIKGKEADGGTVDFIDVPDNQVQLGAVKEVIALFGDRAAEKKNIKHTGNLKIEIVDYSNARTP